ncbi:hypothetical protein HGRIS_014566 [Hohenbuehelia grisea]|uniref:Carboxylic ester hydrolase n=1 Tax=Hohenbuehelia grisea TaxID=104357 RepID=A0ABR3JUU3_9AGAR
MLFSARIGAALIFVGATSASILPRAPDPTVQLDSGTFTGRKLGRTDRFLGIPFAKPPTGDLRFRRPVSVDSYEARSYDASAYGPACPQHDFHGAVLESGLVDNVVSNVINTFWAVFTPDNEDCLSLNVIKPSNVPSGTKLPVVVWIYGGGFQIGGTATYDGTVIVERSIQLNEPVVYVSMNYRLGAFGFLASQEVKDAKVGNLGLYDQREALHWVQKYIGAFGGDPAKVTIWGESAGSFSVGLQMLANGGDPQGLFRAGFMQSGTIIPVGDITHGQKYYDAIVEDTGCAGESDTLQCLRALPYDILKSAADQTPSILGYESLAAAWAPRVDSEFITDVPHALVKQGKIASVPFVAGNTDDEGTLFAFASRNVTTTAEFKGYIKSVLLPDISGADLDTIATLYPADITRGSPYDTGILNALTPQFKRIASLLGDAVLTGPRRFLLNEVSAKQNSWSFLSKRFKATPFFGSFHATDLFQVYGAGELQDYVINFVNNLDPNGQHLRAWPKYSTSSRQQMTFLDSIIPTSVTVDNYRVAQIDFVVDVLSRHPL